jgi:uncharacterized surface protein with fasciclin (FAS1) repeats
MRGIVKLLAGVAIVMLILAGCTNMFVDEASGLSSEDELASRMSSGSDGWEADDEDHDDEDSVDDYDDESDDDYDDEESDDDYDDEDSDDEDDDEDSDDEDDDADDQPKVTIVDVASSSEDFEILTQAVVFAGLAETLSGHRQFTVFAPTDDAFVALLEALGLTADELFAPGNEALVRSILLYHVAPGERFAEDVLDSDRVNTLLKEFAFVEVDDDGAFIGNETYGFAEIIATDIDVSNGVIHVIDAVLLQPSLML